MTNKDDPIPYIDWGLLIAPRSTRFIRWVRQYKYTLSIIITTLVLEIGLVLA